MPAFLRKYIVNPAVGFFTVRKYSPQKFATSCLFKLATVLSLFVALYCWTTGNYILVAVSLALDAYLLFMDVKLIRACIRERRTNQEKQRTQ